MPSKPTTLGTRVSTDDSGVGRQTLRSTAASECPFEGASLLPVVCELGVKLYQVVDHASVRKARGTEVPASC